RWSRGDNYQNCCCDDDEEPGQIRSSMVAYDLVTDYPTRLSTDYCGVHTNGPRGGKLTSFGERNVSMMKERLGIGRFSRSTLDAVTGTDQLAKCSKALQKELFMCHGEEGAQGQKSNDRQGWERSLRRLVRTSQILPDGTKAILARHSSIMEDSVAAGEGRVRNRRIAIENEQWDQQRRWMWHALDQVCVELYNSAESSKKKD